MKEFSVCFLIVTIFLLPACANVRLDSEADTPVYAVHVAEPDRVRFSGRGAGAGMMLAGSMGAMGIAIGVAIDEGIAKDIAETALAANLEFESIFKEVLAENEMTDIRWVSESELGSRLYRIDQYGFVVAKGGDDEVYPSIVIETIEADGSSRTVEVPEDYMDTPEILPRARFETIKTDAREIERLWGEGLRLIFQ